VLRGLDINGKFRAAPAKEYPPEFCKLIAAAMHDFVVQHLPSSSCSFEEDCTELNAKLSKFYMPLDPYYEAHVTGAIGQDFANSTSRPKTARQLAKQADKELYTINFHVPSVPHQEKLELKPTGIPIGTVPIGAAVLQNTPNSEGLRALARAKRVRLFTSTHFGSDAGAMKVNHFSSVSEAEPLGSGACAATRPTLVSAAVHQGAGSNAVTM
jgi:hypothetical protein